jgi:hypothetical protein
MISMLPVAVIALGTLFRNSKPDKRKKMVFLRLSIAIVCILGFAVNSMGVLVWIYHDWD